MKELKRHHINEVMDMHALTRGELGYSQVYYADDVDNAIAELKAENERLKNEKKKMYTKLQHDTIIDAMSRSHHKELRATKRTLWIARAERANVTTLLWNVYCYQNNCLYFRDFMNEKCNPFRDLPKKTAMEWSDLWESIEKKCLGKAEEYR